MRRTCSAEAGKEVRIDPIEVGRRRSKNERRGGSMREVLSRMAAVGADLGPRLRGGAVTLLVGAAFGFGNPAARAQESPTPSVTNQPAVAAATDAVAATPPASALENQTEEIVVTARKRRESIQDIPASIDAIPESVIKDAHITQLDDIGSRVSNLNIFEAHDNSPAVVMRGVGSFELVQGVGFYMNDVQLFEGQTVRPMDIARIEVLKGPQGTLYGGNNIGGAIKYITKLPTDAFEAQVGAEAGNYNTQTYSAVVSGALAPGLLDGRLSVYDTESNGYIYNTALNELANRGTERGGRATLVYNANATTVTLYLSADYNRSGAGASLYYRPASDHDYTLNVNDGTEPSYSRHVYSATLKLEHEFAGDVALTSISSYLHSYADSVTDTDKGPIPFLTGFDHFRHAVGSEEVRLASTGAGPFKWLIGLFGKINNNDIALVSRSFS